jgi:hypothetical protein
MLRSNDRGDPLGEDSVGQPVFAHGLPDVFDRVEFGAFSRQGDNGDVGRYGYVLDPR